MRKRFWGFCGWRMALLALVFCVFSLQATAWAAARELPFVPAPEGGRRLVVTFTGDCTLGSDEWLKGQKNAFDTYVQQEGHAYPFLKLQEVFANDDLTVINLESVFSDSRDNRAQKNYTFRGPTDFADILTTGSVEAAFLANNHTMDYGKPGMQSTVNSLEQRGIGWFGTNYAANKTLVFEKDGIKIGLFGSYYSYWGSNFNKMRQAVNELKEAGCQAIVGIVHDGVEYAPHRHFRQEDMARWMINNGANLIIGHHPHVPQGVDLVGDATVVYSLGNCSFGGNISLDISRRPGVRADKALLAQVALYFSQAGDYLGQQVNLIPISPSGTMEYNNYQPVLLGGEMARETLQLVQDDTPFALAPFQEGIGALQPYLPAASPDQDEEIAPTAN